MVEGELSLWEQVVPSVRGEGDVGSGELLRDRKCDEGGETRTQSERTSREGRSRQSWMRQNGLTKSEG